MPKMHKVGRSECELIVEWLAHLDFGCLLAGGWGVNPPGNSPLQLALRVGHSNKIDIVKLLLVSRSVLRRSRASATLAHTLTDSTCSAHSRTERT